MIPVFGLPILNKTDLLQRMFNTIDEPIGRLFIVDNGNVVRGNGLRWPHDVQSYHVMDPGYNMGVAASWNHIIKANMNAPYWVIACNDVILEAGALTRLRESIESQTGPALSRLQMGNEALWGNHFGVFAVNAAAIEKVGWFDENLHPIYFEDTDWMRRAERLDVPMPLVLSSTHHDGTQSWAGNDPLGKQNKVSWDGNVAYFDDKWSHMDGLAQLEDEWFPPSLERLRAQAWKIDRKDSGIS